jgi:hypothetical protein
MQIPEVGENSVLIFLTTSVDIAVGVMGMKGRTPFNLMLPSRVGESHFNISQSSASPEFCFFSLVATLCCVHSTPTLLLELELFIDALSWVDCHS